jgi:putative transposase
MRRANRPILTHATYFITCITHQRKKIFSNPQLAQIAIDQWKHYEKTYEFTLHAYCVMHDHYHVLLDVGKKKTISQILHAVNSYTATLINKVLDQEVKMKIFQRGYWDEIIRDQDMYWQKVSYILTNPYRMGLVRHPMNSYLYSNLNEWMDREGEEFLIDLFSRNHRWYE